MKMGDQNKEPTEKATCNIYSDQGLHIQRLQQVKIPTMSQITNNNKINKKFTKVKYNNQQTQKHIEISNTKHVYGTQPL